MVGNLTSRRVARIRSISTRPRPPQKHGPFNLARSLPFSGLFFITDVAFVLASVFFFTTAYAVDKCNVTASVDEIAPGVYVRSGRHAAVFKNKAIANIGFVIGEKLVAVIDTGGSDEEGRELKCAIQQISRLPIRYVINTHVHPDHVLGNVAFDNEQVEFVGHAKLPRAMALRGDIYLTRAAARSSTGVANTRMVLPDRVVDDTLELDLGGRKLLITAHLSGHTDHDVTVYDDRTNTLWLSDLLFVEHIPVLDAGIVGWISVLRGLMAQPVDHAVPGHGPSTVPWPGGAAPIVRYLTLLRDETRRWIVDGGDLRSAQDKVGYNEQGCWRMFGEYHRRNVTTAFTELEWED